MGSERRVSTAVLGGTFDRPHIGHDALLRAAFDAADFVSIGVTTVSYLRQHPKLLGERIAPYSVRASALRRYLERRFPGRAYRISPLRDGFGGSVRPGIDLLVLTPETREGGRAVNRERRRRGLPPLRVLEVPRVMAEDGFPVSSSRVRAGEIDRWGRRRRPLRIAIVSPGGPGLAVRARRLLRRRFDQTKLRFDPPSVRDHPENRTLIATARLARRLARQALPDHDVAVALVRRRPADFPSVAVETSLGSPGDAERASASIRRAIARGLRGHPD